MTEKRFIVDDAGTLIDMESRNTFDYVSDVCGLLNELYEENEQLEQFKNTVFDCINKKIEEVDTIGAEVLKDLRRELVE